MPFIFLFIRLLLPKDRSVQTEGGKEGGREGGELAHKVREVGGRERGRC